MRLAVGQMSPYSPTSCQGASEAAAAGCMTIHAEQLGAPAVIDRAGAARRVTGATAVQEPFRYWGRWFRNTLFLLLVDTYVLWLALVFGDTVLQALRGIPIQIGRGLVILPMWWAGAVALRVVPGWGTNAVEHLRRTELLLAGVFAAVTAALVLVPPTARVSRITFLVAFASCAVLVPLAHALVRGLLIRLGEWGVPVAIYGNDTTAAYAVNAMLEEPGLGYRPLGVFDDEAEPGERIHGIPVLGRTDGWSAGAPFAVLGAPNMTRQRLMALLEGPLSHYRRVVILPDLFEGPSLWVKPRDFLGVLGLELASSLLSPVARHAKYWGERLTVVVFAPLWVPLLFLLSLAIRAEDGEFPFFLQERMGRGGRLFRVIKFRTMRPDAEEVLARELLQDEGLREEWASSCKLRNDPRITRVGRFLRRTSLDEVPQLVNVLIGDMSLVGPRPLPSYHHAQLPEKARRLREQVLPGVTGLWQVSGRSATGTAGMERWDSYYVRNWSLWLDLVILARTARAVFRGQGAW